MIYNLANTVNGEFGPVCIFDANGLEWDQCLECDTETGRIVRNKVTDGHLTEIDGVLEQETVFTAAPLVVRPVRPDDPPCKQYPVEQIWTMSPEVRKAAEVKAAIAVIPAGRPMYGDATSEHKILISAQTHNRDQMAKLDPQELIGKDRPSFIVIDDPLPKPTMSMEGPECKTAAPESVALARHYFPVRLVCPCGQPLELARVGFEWVLGHINSTCSPLIHGQSAEGVLLKMLEIGKLPTFAEFRQKQNADAAQPKQDSSL